MRPVLRAGPVPLFLSLCLLFLCWSPGGGARAADSPLRMASFNIQIFGQSKMKKAAAVSTLLRILDRYDLVFIMEIRDSDDTAIYELLNRLNQQSSKNYQIIVSERLGRTNSKEQYAYLYNPDKVMPDQAYVWNDTRDLFEREPYVARFRFGGDSFTMIGIHTSPSDVTTELNALPPVYNEAKQKLGSRNIFIVGDLNADCSYYNPNKGFDFFGDKSTALVPEGSDTTVANTSCTYDRVLAFGNLPRASSTAKPFNFQTAYSMPLADAQVVSDHYPVEGTLSDLRDSTEPPDNEPPVVIIPDPVPSQGSVAQCGVRPTFTPRGYCYAEFGSSRKRVANACCSR
ncbi:MAG TPA: endonuclease/exonuclease/phosphatase family protein [Oligoflexus sp.]|uniref:endonuclease/exonuclease/phosphatase family protein n=1 Tax=Oligoflexus sp. TaxID=1971216 RepID=UPI002D74CFAE|nr:endonuclease/exonuclease/phosphatase family protein [Oligoflexus sp.]HYX33434.1 endonuclease/exonuclease/phosphatase family protein [Oligoflexus sp.]